MEENKYLTKELIENIQQRAKDPIWKMGILASMTSNWYDIIVVSKNEIIHFVGNTDTGWKHISDRHGYYSDTNYFGYGKIGDPSKFTRTSIPIYDYVNIADDIFSSGIKDNKQHKKSYLFDKYRGKSNRYTGSDGSFKDFCLIFYKGTRIVHSIYPENDLVPDRPKRILKEFARCKDKVTYTQLLKEDFFTISIPYENKNKVIRYEIVIRLNENTMFCKLYIQVNNYKGVPLLTLYPEQCTFKANIKSTTLLRSDNIEFMRFLNGLSNADFSAIEERISIFEDDLKKKIKY